MDLKPVLDLTGRSSDKWESLFGVSEDSPVNLQNTPIGYLWDGSDERYNFE
jgi:hypothetical protein